MGPPSIVCRSAWRSHILERTWVTISVHYLTATTGCPVFSLGLSSYWTGVRFFDSLVWPFASIWHVANFRGGIFWLEGWAKFPAVKRLCPWLPSIIQRPLRQAQGANSLCQLRSRALGNRSPGCVRSLLLWPSITGTAQLGQQRGTRQISSLHD